MPCPVCSADRLVNLNYVFGDQLGQYSGRIRSTPELDEMQIRDTASSRSWVVEVCVECGWNHMIASYLLGDGVTPPSTAPPADRRGHLWLTRSERHHRGPRPASGKKNGTVWLRVLVWTISILLSPA